MQTIRVDSPFLAAVFCLALLTPSVHAAEPTWAEVFSIFQQRCIICHQGSAAENGLQLDTLEGLRAGSDSGPVVLPDQPAESELLRRVRGQSLPRMPLTGPPWLSVEDISLLERWIAAGAPDDQGKPTPIPVGARVRFEGTLTAKWELDGQPLSVDSGTRIDKELGIGDRVEVLGVVEQQGAIRVTRLRRR